MLSPPSLLPLLVVPALLAPPWLVRLPVAAPSSRRCLARLRRRPVGLLVVVLSARCLRDLRGRLQQLLGPRAVVLVLPPRVRLLVSLRVRRAPCALAGLPVVAWVWVVAVVVVLVGVVVVAVGPTVAKRRPKGALPTGSGCLPGVSFFCF